jgi:hypothetical protein
MRIQIYPPPPNFEGNADEWITGFEVEADAKPRGVTKRTNVSYTYPTCSL